MVDSSIVVLHSFVASVLALSDIPYISDPEPLVRLFSLLFSRTNSSNSINAGRSCAVSARVDSSGIVAPFMKRGRPDLDAVNTLTHVKHTMLLKC